MQFRILAITAVLPFVSAYPITVDGVNCRAGPGTGEKIVKKYAIGADVDVICQQHGQMIEHNTLWDKTGDDCYVSDYYVKTGSDSMIADYCDNSWKEPEDSSEYKGKITRKEIMERANFWIQQHIPYSMTGYEPDHLGRDYRTDCSGFISMAFHAAPAYSTINLPDIAQSIEWGELKEGDFVGTLGEGTGGKYGHVTLFKSWVDDEQTVYNTVECKGTDGCVEYQREKAWTNYGYTSKPYRYTNVEEE